MGGEIAAQGDERLVQSLGSALDVSADEAAVMADVHGFHSYPARLHPLTAARLIEAFSPARGRVLDPFCGSGTVLVEARRLGRHAFCVDINPLAIELAHLKARGANGSERQALLEAAARVAAHADDRRLKRAGPSRRYGPEDRELFDVHVLLELDGLKSGIESIREPFERHALLLVLSSIMTKLSRRKGDSTGARVEKRLAAGHAVRLFSRKATDLVRRLEAFERTLPAASPPARVALGDARKLPHVRPRSIDLVVSSPPYPGVYDYFSQHVQRLRWLDLGTGRFEAGELGARRKLNKLGGDAALRHWEQELLPCLGQIARVLAPGGKAVLVVADSVLGGRPVYAEDLLRGLVPRAGLNVVAAASQLRPHFHFATRGAFKARPRREHALLLQSGSVSS